MKTNPLFPHLARIETRAEHGAGKLLEKPLKKTADM